MTPREATTIKTFVLGVMLALALGSLAEARGRAPMRRLGLHRPAVTLASPRPLRERNIRSGDHFAWRQGGPRP